jgi:hypothetical protein
VKTGALLAACALNSGMQSVLRWGGGAAMTTPPQRGIVVGEIGGVVEAAWGGGDESVVVRRSAVWFPWLAEERGSWAAES